MFIFKKSCIVA